MFIIRNYRLLPVDTNIGNSVYPKKVVQEFIDDVVEYPIDIRMVEHNNYDAGYILSLRIDNDYLVAKIEFIENLKVYDQLISNEIADSLYRNNYNY